ncbi:MAG TPA: hypothetical protein VFS75_01375 [Candidatus Paceibacterota bacterium]|nr:hypothetical protein [Candidatus Paceibacterota bacterium]
MPREPGFKKIRGERYWCPWTFDHLGGKRPDEHPPVERVFPKHGRYRIVGVPVLAPGQVWVEDVGYLVVVLGYSEERREVTFRYYKCPLGLVVTRPFHLFRKHFKVWEDAVRSRAIIRATYHRMLAAHGLA